MKICALLSFYDESPHWLATCVAGIGRFADTVIAVDGAYALYPGARPRSHPLQSEAIIQAAEMADLELILHRPRTVWWGNEVAKRNYCLKLAGTVLETDRDWVAVVDADYHLLQVDPEIMRARLDATPHRVATYTLLDGKDMLTDEGLHRYVAANICDHEWTFKTRDLYRWDPSLRVGPAHWTYSALVDGSWQWLRGPWGGEADCEHLGRDLVFYHRTMDRTRLRRETADDYYHIRHAQRIEWMEHYEPGDPPDGFKDEQRRLWKEWAEQFKDVSDPPRQLA